MLERKQHRERVNELCLENLNNQGYTASHPQASHALVDLALDFLLVRGKLLTLLGNNGSDPETSPSVSYVSLSSAHTKGERFARTRVRGIHRPKSWIGDAINKQDAPNDIPCMHCVRFASSVCADGIPPRK